MIIKTISRKSNVKKLIDYVFKDEAKLQNAKFNPMVYKHNVFTNDKSRWAKQIEFNNTLRKRKIKNEVKCYHTIISFHPKDSQAISKKILKDIAQKFVEIRGADAQHVITYHVEKTDHIHLHCITGGTKYLQSVANRQSKQEFEKMKKELEAYQLKTYPTLFNSIVFSKSNMKELNSIRNKEQKIEKQKQVRGTVKETVEKKVQEIFTTSKSHDEFFQKIRDNGFETYERGGKISGLISQDIKFRFSKLGYDANKLNELSSNKKELNSIRNGRDAIREIRNIQFENQKSSILNHEEKNDEERNIDNNVEREIENTIDNTNRENENDQKDVDLNNTIVENSENNELENEENEE